MAHPRIYTAPESPPYASPYVLPPAAMIPPGRLGRGLGTTTVTTTGGMLALWLVGAGVAGLVVGGGLMAYAGSSFFR